MRFCVVKVGMTECARSAVSIFTALSWASAAIVQRMNPINPGGGGSQVRHQAGHTFPTFGMISRVREWCSSVLSRVRNSWKLIKAGDERDVHAVEIGGSCAQLWKAQSFAQGIVHSYTSMALPYRAQPSKVLSFTSKEMRPVSEIFSAQRCMLQGLRMNRLHWKFPVYPRKTNGMSLKSPSPSLCLRDGEENRSVKCETQVTITGCSNLDCHERPWDIFSLLIDIVVVFFRHRNHNLSSVSLKFIESSVEANQKASKSRAKGHDGRIGGKHR